MENAIDNYERAIRLDSGLVAAYIRLSLATRLAGQSTKALTALQGWVKLVPTSFDAYVGLAAVSQQMGAEKKHNQFVAKARRLSTNQPPYGIACLESVAGNINAALQALEKAVADKSFDHSWAGLDPDLENARSDKRFWTIIERPAKQISEH